MTWRRILLNGLLALASAALSTGAAYADLRTAPGWWDPDGVSTGFDWHYRVPISVPAGAPVNSTVKVDVDFTALLTQMGVSGTFDSASPIVIRSTGVIAKTQEFNDTIYAGATDPTGNGRGEIRFLVEDAGPVTYYLYFDITTNGSKAASAAITTLIPINGNFEHSATGQSTPTGWAAPTVVTGFDAQVRPSETVSVTIDTPSAADGIDTRSTNGTPNTGAFSYLMGVRTTATDPGAVPGATFSRAIVVPTTNPGTLSFSYRPEGWDSVYNATAYDYLSVDILNSGGTVLATLVEPTTTANATVATSYAAAPASPNLGSGGNTGPAATGLAGYNQYNGFDCDLNGVHQNGMTVACHSEPWFTVNQSLAAYAGQTITLRFRAFSTSAYQSWYSLDDIAWSVNAGTLGTPQAWGINIVTPAAGTNYVPGQTIPVTVQVDAKATGLTTPITVNLYDNVGTLRVSGVVLYNDGTHGDTAANDAIWSNSTGLVMPLSATTATGWVLRAYGLDTSTTTIAGATNGLAHIPAAATTMNQSDFYNIDENLENVTTAALTVTKIGSATSDPVNGTTNPKLIPGATVHYCILITNTGPQPAGNVVQTDVLPAAVTYVAGTLKSGTTCANATTTPPTGASIAGTTITANIGTLASGAAYALAYDVTIN